MPGNYGFKYWVDIVMCIDGTGSMGPLLDTVKNKALSFYDDLVMKMASRSREVEELRVKVIVFRDYLADGENSMLVSDFYTLPKQAQEFETLVKSIQPFGGGDDPEDGLEALAYAMKSDWTRSGHKRRHIIIVWTDEGTHPLGFGKNPENGRNLTSLCGIPWEQIQHNAERYPQELPKDFDELTGWWGDDDLPGVMDNAAKRLLLFAPDKECWNTLLDVWGNVIHYQAMAGQGLTEIEYEEIIQSFCC